MGKALAIACGLTMSFACGRIGYDPTSGTGSAGDAALPFSDASQEWWDESYVSRTELRLNNLGIAEELVNFPVLVRLTPSVFDYAQAQADGSDIRFVAGDGTTELVHEIERFVVGGDSIFWVSVPRVLANSDQTTIWLYFGNASPGPRAASEKVWGEYHAVYHLSDASTDSTGKHAADPGDGVAMQVPSAAMGHVGGGQEFDGVDDLITIPGESFNFTEPAITLGAWVELGNLRPDWNNFLGIGGYGSGYRMGIHGIDGQAGFQCPGETHTMNSAARAIPPGWHHIVSTWDGEFLRHYFDGELDVVPMARTGSFVPSTADFRIGLSQFAFRGIIDEVRVANLARSAEWLAANMRSMNGTMVIFE